MWLKSPKRVAGLLWLYFVMELVQALLEREVRRKMRERNVSALALYPEASSSEAPTAELVMRSLEGHRRHRLIDAAGRCLRTFHDPMPEASRRMLELLEIDGTAYGLA